MALSEKTERYFLLAAESSDVEKGCSSAASLVFGGGLDGGVQAVHHDSRRRRTRVEVGLCT